MMALAEVLAIFEGIAGFQFLDYLGKYPADDGPFTRIVSHPGVNQACSGHASGEAIAFNQVDLGSQARGGDGGGTAGGARADYGQWDGKRFFFATAPVWLCHRRMAEGKLLPYQTLLTVVEVSSV